MFTIMDEYTRECVVIVDERHLNQEDVLATVFDLFIDRGVPEYIRSDNGSEGRVFDWKSMSLMLPVIHSSNNTFLKMISLCE